MRVDVEVYRRLWRQSDKQPQVAGPVDDPTYQRLGRYVRAIACEATQPFAVPVGITAQVTGLSPVLVGEYVGKLVRNGVMRVVQYGAPGRFTRYLYGPHRPARIAC